MRNSSSNATALAAGQQRGPQSPPLLSGVQATYLVANREVRAQLRSKAFIGSTIAVLLIVVIGVILSALTVGRAPAPSAVAVVAETEQLTASSELLQAVSYPDADAARVAVENGEVDAALLPSEDTPLGFFVLVVDEPPQAVLSEFTVYPTVEALEPEENSAMVQYFVGFGFALLFLVLAMTFGQIIATNTVSEKQTRTVELLLSAIPARSLLAGKILGNSLLAGAEMVLIMLVAMVGLLASGQGELLSMLTAPMLWFVLFFVVGFVMLASVFAASASLVSRVEDVGSVLMPAMMLVFLPYFLVLFGGQSSTLMEVASYIPVTSVVTMPVRAFLGDVPWWQPVISLALMVLTTWLVVLLGARIYKASLLKTGKRVKLSEALRRE